MTAVVPEEIDAFVARRLLALRRERGLTLTELAEQVGISPAHLSRLEKGERQPSLAVLVQLARVYSVPVGSILEAEEAGDHQLVRAAEAFTHRGPQGSYTVLSGARATLASVRIELRPGQRSDEARHPGEEWLHVLAGALRLDLAGRAIDLDEGDSVQFDSALPHRLSARGRRVATVLVVSTSATAPMQHPVPTGTDRS